MIYTPPLYQKLPLILQHQILITLQLLPHLGMLIMNIGKLANSSKAYKEILSLPLYPRMSVHDVERVIGVVTDLISSHRR